jgi:phosphohistidine phosphatase
MDNVDKDVKRQVTKAGKKEVAKIAKNMQDMGVKLDVIATSPLTRAKQTAEIVKDEYDGGKLRMVEWDELKPSNDTKRVYERLRKLKDDSRVLLVGHEPHLSSIIGEIIAGKTTDVSIDLKKAGLAKLEVTRFKPKIDGRLLWLLTPKQLKMMKN